MFSEGRSTCFAQKPVFVFDDWGIHRTFKNKVASLQVISCMQGESGQ
jgi:hypothetical protein